jgi:hypothetical protein
MFRSGNGWRRYVPNKDAESQCANVSSCSAVVIGIPIDDGQPPTIPGGDDRICLISGFYIVYEWIFN